MACESPCFDCPYLRDAEKLKIADIDIFDLVFTHFTEDGGFKHVICEEQNDICFGQIQMLANGTHDYLDPFSELGESVETLKSNWKDYFIGPWEFISHHRELNS